ncbi:isoprenylcysteine carboxylmethyltransferase family protein [Pseudoxanthomonas sp. JBR18]|uniref:methyltransferase family protein n=1 Tax=Pseudoxanthomonas sp. JBR18 TaxID=2969308 RepID=UPI0023060925|nr:isoprenylcysteine carboxylmethyltransferase family protein [Pseudoxanthomonas sp. JBR18]WCE05040.1 isoprenylcysteine carboxylmethyltransferase family protein [Pseudoxanthomonas sp. JBR18]
MPRALETRLPPPVLLGLLGIGLWWAARRWPDWTSAWSGAPWIGAAIALGGGYWNVAPKRRFRRAATTVNPMRPQSARALVTTGLHARSRNPMYVGQVLVLAGWGVGLRTGLVVPALLVQVLWLTWLQIVPEERALQARFGEAYTAYRQRVRRWL